MRDPRDPGELVHEDIAFHADVVAASGNRTLASPVRAHDSLAAFTAASRHVGDGELWVRDRLDAVRDRRRPGGGEPAA